MKPYEHVVKYYECDRMGIVHHSNYVRFMEEARVACLASSTHCFFENGRPVVMEQRFPELFQKIKALDE